MSQGRYYLVGVDRLRELILYVCRLSEDDPSFGATKLNKLLFFIDFAAYKKFGESISRVEYVRLDNGPAPQVMQPLREEMVELGDMVIAERDYYGHTQKKPYALREPRLSDFTADQVVIIQDVVKRYADRSARDLSEKSHEFVGWKYARTGHPIPYSAALLEDREPTEEEKAFAFTLDLSELEEELRQRNASAAG